MKTLDVSAGSESEEDLGRPAEDVKKAIRKRSLAVLLGCLVAMPIGYFGILSLDKERAGRDSPAGVASRAIQAPKTAMRTISYGTCSILLFGGGLLGLYSLLKLGFPRLSTPPLSTDPENTVELYYRNLIHADRKSYNVPSYQYLLQQARDDIGGYQGFMEHHAASRTKVLDELRDRLGEREIRGAGYSLLEVKRTGATGDMEHYSVRISVDPTRGFSDTLFGAEESTDRNGDLQLREECSVARVGGSWLIASARWTGQLVTRDGSI